MISKVGNVNNKKIMLGPKGQRKIFLRPGPPYLRVWMTAPPLSEGLDLPLTSGGFRGGARGPGPPSFLDQNEAQRAEKIFFEAGPPLISWSG